LEQEWHADTGATHHLTNNFNNLNVRSEEYAGNDQIQVGDGTGLHITHLGKASLSAHSKSFILNQILVVPQITKNLISIKKFTEDNSVYFEFHASCFLIKDYSGNTLPKGVVKDGLYCFSQPLQHLYPKALVCVRVSVSDWHCRLGHASYNTVNHVIRSNNLSFLSNKRHKISPECEMAKSHNLPFSASVPHVTKPLELIYLDVWGPSFVISSYGSRYYVCFLDAFTKYIWLFPLKQKSDVENIFLHFQTYVERHFNTKIKVIQTDWGGEYHRLNTYFSKCGIQHRLACPYTHEQMGAVERRHRQIVEMGLALLAYANLPKPYWEDAFLTAVYIINRLPTKILNHYSPFEKAYHQKPNYNFIRVFGCACWPNLRPYNKHKFDYRSKTCIFIGYSLSHQGYKCLDLSTGKIFVS